MTSRITWSGSGSLLAVDSLLFPALSVALCVMKTLLCGQLTLTGTMAHSTKHIKDIP
jgi:hypothetical protein